MYRVLIIEDERSIAELVQIALERTGRFECVWAVQISSAIGILEANGIDCVLLDKTLRDSDGLEGLKDLMWKFPTLPIVIGTGDGDHARALKALRMGAQGCIFKPYNVERLPMALEDAIARQDYVNKQRVVAVPHKRSKVEWGVIIGGSATILAAVIKAISDWLN